MKLNYLLVFVPLSLILDWFGANPVLIFITATLATIPLAGIMAEATETLAVYLGPSLGGLLNASFGNAPEIIIGLLALKKGLPDVVKASFTGSILGNLVLGLGLSMIVGGAKHGFQRFDKLQAGMSAALLLLAAIGLIMPAMAEHVTPSHDVEITMGTAATLLVVYALSVVFTLRHGGQIVDSEPTAGSAAPPPPAAHSQPHWSRGKALGILIFVTVVLAFVSEVLTGAVEPASKSMGFTPVFAGVIALALAGNTAQLYNAIRFSASNKMDLALSITVGASTQVALFVAPLLALTSGLVGTSLDLVFTPFEVVSIVLAVFVTSKITADGECNWMEGVLLVGVYLIFGVVFYALPA
ncbi:MAG: calcium/proton exchanger [Pirellulales bacterium]